MGRRSAILRLPRAVQKLDGSVRNANRAERQIAWRFKWTGHNTDITKRFLSTF
jgi:hypothetical protein